MTSAGNVFTTDHELDPSEIGVSAPIIINLPEPSTAVLVVLALLGAGVATRRRVRS